MRKMKSPTPPKASKPLTDAHKALITILAEAAVEKFLAEQAKTKER